MPSIAINPQPCKARVSHYVIKGDAEHFRSKMSVSNSFDDKGAEHYDNRAALKQAFRTCTKNVIFSVSHETEPGLA